MEGKIFYLRRFLLFLLQKKYENCTSTNRDMFSAWCYKETKRTCKNCLRNFFLKSLCLNQHRALSANGRWESINSPDWSTYNYSYNCWEVKFIKKFFMIFYDGIVNQTKVARRFKYFHISKLFKKTLKNQ